MIRESQKTAEIKKAWLIRWASYGPEEDGDLRELGIKNKIVDIISARESFRKILEKSKEIYIRETQSLVKKIYFANYKEGKKRRNEFWQSILWICHPRPDDYRKYIKLIDEEATSDKIERARKMLSDSVSIKIGDSPQLMLIAEKAFDIVIYEDDSNVNKIEWNIISGGKTIRLSEKYRHYSKM